MINHLKNKFINKLTPLQKLDLLVNNLRKNNEDLLRILTISPTDDGLINLGVTSDIYEVYTSKQVPVLILFIKENKEVHISFNITLLNKISVFMYNDLKKILPDLHLEHDYYRNELGYYFFDEDAELAFMNDLQSQLLDLMEEGQKQTTNNNNDLEYKNPVTCVVGQPYHSPKSVKEALLEYRFQKNDKLGKLMNEDLE